LGIINGYQLVKAGSARQLVVFPRMQRRGGRLATSYFAAGRFGVQTTTARGFYSPSSASIEANKCRDKHPREYRLPRPEYQNGRFSKGDAADYKSPRHHHYGAFGP